MHDVRTADMRNRLVPHIEEMIRRQHADELVIGQDAVAFHARMIVAIDHHDRGADARQLPQQILIRIAVHGREDDAVDLTAAQHLELGALFRHILARAAQQQPVSAHARHRLNARDDLDEKRMHEIGNDDADGVTAAKRQAAGDGISLVAELLDLGEHAAASGRADVPVVVQDFGNGHHGHAELAGDPSHRGSGHGLFLGYFIVKVALTLREFECFTQAIREDNAPRSESRLPSRRRAQSPKSIRGC